jgi:hypothetical protein
MAAWAFAAVGPLAELRHQRNATWFARNRAGGRRILYHRHIAPVLVRDWSVRMEVFEGTVAASADTWKFRNAATKPLTVKDAHDLVEAEYLRPFAAPSDYRDTAVSPAPGPCASHRVHTTADGPNSPPNDG